MIPVKGSGVVGEPIVEGKAASVKAAVIEMLAYLVGMDARPIDDHWNVLYRSAFLVAGRLQ